MAVFPRHSRNDSRDDDIKDIVEEISMPISLCTNKGCPRQNHSTCWCNCIWLDEHKVFNRFVHFHFCVCFFFNFRAYIPTYLTHLFSNHDDSVLSEGFHWILCLKIPERKADLQRDNRIYKKICSAGVTNKNEGEQCTPKPEWQGWTALLV